MSSSVSLGKRRDNHRAYVCGIESQKRPLGLASFVLERFADQLDRIASGPFQGGMIFHRKFPPNSRFHWHQYDLDADGAAANRKEGVLTAIVAIPDDRRYVLSLRSKCLSQNIDDPLFTLSPPDERSGELCSEPTGRICRGIRAPTRGWSGVDAATFGAVRWPFY